jgi:glycosyltransferase involved in cell wall biosynthesis
MRIAQIVASVDPRLGGPSVSVPRLARALSRLQHKVDLVSIDAHPGDPEINGFLTATKFAPSWPALLGFSYRLRQFLKRGGHDIIQANGLWHRSCHYAGLASKRNHKPLVLSPRGMLSPWAINYKRWRKRLGGPLIHPGILHRASAFHATSLREADEIRALGLKQPICVAPNGIDAPTTDERTAALSYWKKACPEAFERPTALFYSRFHP